MKGRLVAAAKEAVHGLRGLRRPRTTDVFERLGYVTPSTVHVSNYGAKRPFAVFNPGAALVGRRLHVFPRLVFDYYQYVSSIGHFSLDVEELLSEGPPGAVEAEIIMWPRERWEFLGCEDPRAHPVDGGFLLLYTGKGYYRVDGAVEGGRYRDVLGVALLDGGLRVARKGFLRIMEGSSELLTWSNKDSALLEPRRQRGVILTRPEVDGIRMGWRGVADLEEMAIYADTLEPVLAPEEWEVKVGWSTNAVRLPGGGYLVGWHGVLKSDLSYRNGLAVVDGEGRLEAVSDYLLAPRGLVEEYGDRALVIFGDGLVLYSDTLIWVGGVGDASIGFFAAELDAVLEHMRAPRRRG